MISRHCSAAHLCSFLSLIFFTHFLIYITGVDGLHIERLIVPVAAKKGDEQQLVCHYNLDDNEALYALRWYKDDKEFFRYMPKETPALRVFNVSGLKINMGMSTSNSVMLMQVQISASGHYRCEVSTEAPSFETDVKEAHFSVVEPPTGNPFITLAKGTLNPAMNESIVANCSGPTGRPIPQLTWIFGSHAIPVESKHLKQSLHQGSGNLEHGFKDRHNEGRITSMLNLPAEWLINFMRRLEASKLPGQQQIGPYVTLPLRCSSHSLGLYELSDTVEIRIKVKEAPVESTAIFNSSSQNSRSSSSSTASFHGAFSSTANPSSSIFVVSLFSWMTLICSSLMLQSTSTSASGGSSSRTLNRR